MYGHIAGQCPQCRKVLEFEREGHGSSDRCAACQTAVGIASSYAWHVTAASFVVVSFIVVVTYNHQRRGAWLLLMLLFLLPIRLAFRLRTRPWYVLKSQAHKPVFIGAFVAMLAVGYFYLYEGMSLSGLLLGATRREMGENLETLSVPLAWLRPQFLINSQSTFLDVLGVIATNALLYSIPMMLCWSVVRFFLRRNRTTQIGVSSTVDDDFGL